MPHPGRRHLGQGRPGLEYAILPTAEQGRTEAFFRLQAFLVRSFRRMNEQELARQVGISVGGLNYCLKALMEKGLVKMQNFAHSKNKFGYVYVLTAQGIAEKAARPQD